MIKNNHLPNIVLLGAPGSGKGTLAQQLVSKFHYQHLSTGDMFRETVKQNSPLAEKIKAIMARGELVHDDLVNQMIKTYIDRCIQNNTPFVLDGYPRTINQANYLKTICDIEVVIYLDINEELAIKRIIGRRSCPQCHSVYNIYFKKPKHDNMCDNCHTTLIQRPDDSIELAKNRFKVYHEQTYGLVDYYQKQKKLITIKIVDNNQHLLDQVSQIINQ